MLNVPELQAGFARRVPKRNLYKVSNTKDCTFSPRRASRAGGYVGHRPGCFQKCPFNCIIVFLKLLRIRKVQGNPYAPLISYDGPRDSGFGWMLHTRSFG